MDRRPHRRALIECAELEARRLFCLDGDHTGLSTAPLWDSAEAQGSISHSLSADGGSESIDQLSVPAYSSLSASVRKLYLDFNGSGSIDNWGGWWEFGGETAGPTQAFDNDGNNNAFSPQEQADILQIWKGVSEKFSPFNIDVTTVIPTGPAVHFSARVVIGGDGAWYGRGGGVALVGSWGGDGDNVSFVWGNQGNTTYVAEAVAHEAGHMLNNYHQSLFPIADNEYAPGLIMGRGDSGIGRWANTSLTGGTSTTRDGNTVKSKGGQDDLARIDSRVGRRADDVGGSIATATTIALTTSIGITEGNAAGIIERANDADFYRVVHNGGSFDVSALAAEFRRMLDPNLALFTSGGGLVASSSSNNGADGVGERINLSNLNAGTYFLRVQGSGAYGDLGQYQVNVRVGLPTTAFNDTVSTATTLGLFGATDNASVVFGYAGTTIINDSLASNDTIDYFRFRAPANTNQVIAQLSGQTVSTSVSLYQDLNNNGQIDIGEIVGAFNPGTTTQAIHHTSAVGARNYYVRILKSSAAGAGNYTLRVAADAAPSALLPTALTAHFDPQPLNGSKVVYDSIDSAMADTNDYYRARASRNGLMAFYVSNFGSGDVRLDVGNDANSNGIIDAGEFIATSAQVGSGSSEFVENIAVTQGQNLLVRVAGQVANQTSNYSIEAVADYATGGNTTGAITGARDLTNSAAARIREHLGYSVDQFDTFRINPAVGQMTARLTPFGSTAFHRLDIIRDANNNGLLEQGEIIAQTTTSNVNLNATVVSGGTYFLRVRTQPLGEFGSFGNYDLAYTTAGAITAFTPGSPGVFTIGPSSGSSGGYLGFDPDSALGLTNTEDFFQFTLASRQRVDFNMNTAGVGLQIGQLDGQGNFRKLAGVGTFGDIDTALNVNLNAGTYLLRAFISVDERADQAIGGNYTFSHNTAAITDNSAPVVTASAGQYEISPVGASFTFDQDVEGSVDADDVTVRNLADNSIWPIDAVFYNPATRRAGYGVANLNLPDGNYRATLGAGKVQDSSANPIAADASVNFFILAGDATRDRKVNLDDFTVLAANFGLAGQVFSQGNFDYSDGGVIDLTDFTILASQFGKVLPAAGALSRDAGGAAAAPLFGVRTIEGLPQGEDRDALIDVVV